MEALCMFSYAIYWMSHVVRVSAWLQYLLQRKSSTLQDSIKFIINGCKLAVIVKKNQLMKN